MRPRTLRRRCSSTTSAKVNLFITEGKSLGPITEFIVADLDKARNELMEKGCMVVTWEGNGKPCYMRDPFGFVFNLWEV